MLMSALGVRCGRLMRTYRSVSSDNAERPLINRDAPSATAPSCGAGQDTVSAFVIRAFRFWLCRKSRMQGCQDREAHVGTASTARLATASARIRVLLASCAIGATASADHVATTPHRLHWCACICHTENTTCHCHSRSQQAPPPPSHLCPRCRVYSLHPIGARTVGPRQQCRRRDACVHTAVDLGRLEQQ
jgi:hypothetical protein